MINALQLVVYTPLVPLNFPGNAVAVFKQVINIATFDIIPKDDWYPIIFSLPAEKPKNEKFNMLGLGSYFFIMNMGTLFLALSIIYVQVLLLFIVKYCWKGEKRRCCRKFEGFLEEDLFWNTIIRFVYASYIEIVFAVSLNT